jgi:hypothetical protein
LCVVKVDVGFEDLVHSTRATKGFGKTRGFVVSGA